MAYTHDIARIRQLMEECSQLKPCYLIKCMQELLDWDARLRDCYSEEELRLGISILSARICGSKNVWAAMKRYGKFQR